MFEFLKAILGEELYAQFVEKINAYNGDEANKDKKINLANLTDGKYVSKDKYSSLEATHNVKLEELNKANALIAELQKSVKGNEELQGKFTDYENQVKSLQTQLQEEQVKFAVAIALRDAKALDVDYMTFKLKEKGPIELDENGKIKGWDDKLKELQTQFPTQFDDGKKKFTPNHLPGGGDDPEAQPQNLADAIKASYENKN